MYLLSGRTEFDKKCLLFGLSTLHSRCSHYGSSKSSRQGPPPTLVYMRTMAAASGDNILTQLGSLLGKEVVSLRTTDESPPRVAVIDVATMVTGKDARKTAQDIGFVRDRHPEVAQNLGLYKFNGRRQRNTHVATARGIIEIILLLPGRYAARVRRQACKF